jgi:nicotinamide-nucleotide amidase
MKKKKLIESKIALLTIGDEILSGRTQDTNTAWIARKLQVLGFVVGEVAVVADSLEVIVRALRQLSKRYQVIITSGGLGPTHDDVTLEAVSRWGSVRFISHPAYHRILKRRYRTLGRFHEPAIMRQSFVPQGALLLDNPCGVAKGVMFKHQNTHVLSLPGVPREFQAMFDYSVKPWLLTHVAHPPIFVSTIRTAGIAESHLMRQLNSLIRNEKEVQVGFYPEIGEVSIQLKSFNKQKLLKLKQRMLNKISTHVYGFDSDTLESAIGKWLLRKKNHVSLAESCTGGYLSKRLTDVSGASRYFLGSVISYDNQIKQTILNISSDILKHFGAVSAECAREMAKNVKIQFHSSIGLSITGIAGPTGGSKAKPVGLTFIGLSNTKQTKVHRFVFRGDRDQVRMRAVQMALILLWRSLKG